MNDEAPGGGGITEGRAEQCGVVRQEDRSPGAEPAGRRRELLTLTFRDTDMQVLWLATVVYHLGLGMQQVVLGWVVLALTHSEAMVGAVYAVRAAPNLVVGFAVGTLTDRCDRRSLMRLAAFGMAGVSLVVAWLAYTERLTVWYLILGDRYSGHVAGPGNDRTPGLCRGYLRCPPRRAGHCIGLSGTTLRWCARGTGRRCHSHMVGGGDDFCGHGHLL